MEEKTSPVILGTRYKCYKCGIKFYDMGRLKPICPSCGENQDNDELKEIHDEIRRRSLSRLPKTDHIITATEDSDDEVEFANDADAESIADTTEMENLEGMEESEEYTNESS